MYYRNLLSACLIVFAQPALARTVMSFSLSRLAHESDLVMVGTALETEVVVSTEFVMTHEAKVYNNRALVRAVEVLSSTQPTSDTLTIRCRDSDYFGGSICPSIEKDASYLLFLKQTPEGYRPVQIYQGVVLLKDGMASLHFGPMREDLVRRFIGLSLSSKTSEGDWNRLGERLVEQNDLKSSKRTRATFELLSDLPNQIRYEPHYVKALHSRNGAIVWLAIYRLIMNSSERGIREMIGLYKKLDANPEESQNYEEQYLHSTDFERFAAWNLPPQTKAVLTKLKKEYPSAPKFFEGILNE